MAHWPWGSGASGCTRPAARKACQKLQCERLRHVNVLRPGRDGRLKVLPTPSDLGTFPMHMAWHVRHRQDAAHLWLRTLVAELAAAL